MAHISLVHPVAGLASIAQLGRPITDRDAGFPFMDVIGYPPNSFELRFALAGYKATDLFIKVIKNVLHVEGNPPVVEEKGEVLIKRIKNTSFVRKIALAKGTEVTDSILENGILRIMLTVVQEEDQVINIPIR